MKTKTMDKSKLPGLTIAQEIKRQLPPRKRLFPAPPKVMGEFPPTYIFMEKQKSQSLLAAESMPSPGKKSSKKSASPMAGGSQPLPAKSPFKIPIRKVDKKIVWGQVLMFCPNHLDTNFYVS